VVVDANEQRTILVRATTALSRLMGLSGIWVRGVEADSSHVHHGSKTAKYPNLNSRP
jgi:hypothetical protein